jgi:hypothetical protein
MRPKRPRAARYPFKAPVVLTNLDTDQTSRHSTKDLSLFGCHIVPGTCTPAETPVRIKIAYKSHLFEAFGRLTDLRKNGGAGIAFTKIEQRHQWILDEWIAELRNANAEIILQDV